MIASNYHIIALTKIKRTRMVQGQGQVLVREGQKVNAAESVAEYQPDEKFSLLNIRRLLNLNNKEDARRAINCKPGDKLNEGDIIAEKKSLFPKYVRAETDCEVINVIGTQVLVREFSEKSNLLAGFDATVVEILPNKGVILETNGALIQCVWGNQKAGSGLFNPLIEEPDEEITTKSFDVSFRGSVLMGGYCKEPSTLKLADTIPLKGLIIGSLHPDLIPLAMELTIPVVVVDGFGSFPMNRRAFELLKSNGRRNISLNGIYDQEFKEKPEIVIPLNAEGFIPAEVLEYKPGQVVRTNNPPYQGQAGIIKKIYPGFVELSNGLRAKCALIQFPNEDQVTIPLANLDVLE